MHIVKVWWDLTKGLFFASQVKILSFLGTSQVKIYCILASITVKQCQWSANSSDWNCGLLSKTHSYGIINCHHKISVGVKADISFFNDTFKFRRFYCTPSLLCNILHFPPACFSALPCSLNQISLEPSKLLRSAFEEEGQRRRRRYSADCQGALVQLDTDVYSSFNEIQRQHPSDCSLSSQSDWKSCLGVKEMGRLRRKRFVLSWSSDTLKVMFR